jgi:hypothetical protein
VNDETVDKSVCQRFVDHIVSYLDKVRLSPLMGYPYPASRPRSGRRSRYPRGLKVSGMDSSAGDQAEMPIERRGSSLYDSTEAAC